MRVVARTPEGRSCELSDELEDLNYSNVRLGGDEDCTFTLLRSWLDTNPEVQRGSLVRVSDGLDVLWEGRLEDVDRSGGDSERLEVSAYGLGVRLKDDLFQMVFVDRDLESWQEPSAQRQINRLLVGDKLNGSVGVESDPATGGPALALSFDRLISGANNIVEGVYLSPEIPLARLYYSLTNYDNPTLNNMNAGWLQILYASSDDVHTVASSSGNLLPNPDSGYFEPGGSWGAFTIQHAWLGGSSADGSWKVLARYLAVYGSHGLTGVGADPVGFTSDQIVGWVVERVSGIVVRCLQAGSFIIRHFVVDTPTTHEDALAGANEYEGMVWGTWGPNSPLVRSTDGYFDMRRPSESAEWVVPREATDDLGLADELAALYNRVLVNWQDSSGEEQTVERTAVIPALEAAGLTRTQEIDAGTLGSAQEAEMIGDLYFQLQGTEPPSQGSMTVRVPVQHASRGPLPPHHMRADGSNVQVPDALPNGEAVGLRRVDKRVLFPIQRVNVDASQNPPQVSVDLDQTSDRLSVLQARLANLPATGGGGGGGGGGDGWGGSELVQGGVVRNFKGRRRRRKRGGKARK